MKNEGTLYIATDVTVLQDHLVLTAELKTRALVCLVSRLRLSCLVVRLAFSNGILSLTKTGRLPMTFRSRSLMFRNYF